MDILKSGFDFEAWRERMQACRDRLLMLDYDGTLAPFVADRADARPWPGVRERLTSLLHDEVSRVVIITGRAVNDVLPLLALPVPVEVWGSHGWERFHATGMYEAPDLPLHTQRAVEELLAWLNGSFSPECIEAKPASTALHWRGLEATAKKDIERRLHDAPQSSEEQLQKHFFDGGVEWRTPGRNKGHAVETLLNETHPCAAAYLGDDATDEDAFMALDHRGLRVHVHTEARASCADIRIEPPEELLAFLDEWRSNSA
jgi:trehalose 6-phosphate phosphatase